MPRKINGFAISIALLSSWMIIGTVLYDTVGFGRSSISATVILGSLAVIVGRRWLEVTAPTLTSSSLPHHGRWSKGLILILMWSTVLAMALGWDQRSVESVRSLWQILPWWWVMLALSSLLCLAAIVVRGRTRVGLLAAIAFLPVLLLPVLLFPLGTGFDTHLHEAALSVINERGSIDPTTPYYIGYYVIVIIIHTITMIPLVIIHRILVPLSVAAVFGWICQRGSNRTGAWIVPFVLVLFPLSWSTEPTPQSFSFVWLVLTIFLIADKAPAVLIGLTTLGALAIHPLTGIPLTLTFLYHQFLHKATAISKIAAWIIWILALPLLFILLNPASISLQWSWPSLESVVRLPRQFNPFLDTIFALAWNRWLAVAALLLLAVRFDPQEWKQRLAQREWRTLCWASITTAANAFLVSLIPSFQNVIHYETPDFSRRLFTMSALFLLPLALESAIPVVKRIGSTVRASTTIVLATMSIVLIGSTLYTMYPIAIEGYQMDKGYTVGSGDIDAVEWVDQNAQDREYIVLSNQAVSAAAVKRFGFATASHYPIPTGGTLYPFYLQYVYAAADRSTIHQAATRANTNTVYVVINRYWKDSLSLIRASRRIADVSHSTRNGTVWVFRFDHALQRPY